MELCRVEGGLGQWPHDILLSLPPLADRPFSLCDREGSPGGVDGRYDAEDVEGSVDGRSVAADSSGGIDGQSGAEGDGEGCIDGWSAAVDGTGDVDGGF